MHLEFTKSESLSIGIELELQLINLDTLNLSQDAEELLRRLAKIEFPGKVKPEITQSMIEINSTIHKNPDSLVQELNYIKNAITKEARKINLGVCGGGTHPFQKWNERKIFPSKEFQGVLQVYGYLTKMFTVFGQHIHIGCSSGNEAIRLCHFYARYIPHFIALSASSPFYQGMDSDFNSCRLNVISAFPTSGTIPPLLNWKEFEEFYSKITRFELIENIRDLFWDIRPKPEFGTVEIRICDTPLQTNKPVELAAYAQALGKYSIDTKLKIPLDDLYLVYKYNKFQAAKFGFDGIIIDPISKNKIKISDDIINTIETIKPYIENLNLDIYLRAIQNYAISGSNDAKLLRAFYSSLNSLPELVSKQVDLWETTN